MRAAILLLVLVGCAADTVVFHYVSEDSWSTPPSIPVQLRVSKFDQNTITAVAQPATAAESPTGKAEAGTRLPITLDGVACEVNVLGRSSTTVEKSRSAAEERRAPGASAGTRSLRGVTVRISCGDQPVPGTDASQRGAHSRSSTVWGALFLALGIVAGVLIDRRKVAPSLLVGGLALVGGAVFGVVMFEALFRVTYALLFVGHGLAGIIAMRGDSVALRVATIAGAVIGTAIALLLWPVWDAFGPICALVFGAGVAVIGMVAVVLKEG